MDHIAPEHRLRGISHDLNNLLAQAMSPLAGLKRHSDAEVRQAAGSIGLCVETCCGLLTREMGVAASLFAEHCSLHRIAELAMLTARVGTSASITLNLPAASVTLLHDHIVYRAIFNLLHNAVKASGGKGQIELSARCESGVLVITVSDDGPGLPSAVADWFKGQNIEGTIDSDCVGIGLPTTLRMITAIGGTLSAREAPHGSAIEMTLPQEAWESSRLESVTIEATQSAAPI